MAGLRTPLIAPEDLAELLLGPAAPGDVVVLDVRWRLGGPPARPDHDRAHLPGAVFVDLDEELAGPPGSAGRHPLPAPDRLQAALRRAGVGRRSRVVVHDDADGTVAARAWWLLRWAGLPADRVAVLDGGFAGWRAAGLPTSAEPSRPEPGDVTVTPGGMPVLDADGAATVARDGLLLDARAAARYRGEVEPVDPRAGHVPGAVSAPAADLAGPGGRWLPAAVLAERLAGLGVAPEHPDGPDGPDGPGDSDGADHPGGPAREPVPVGAYCGSGVTAASLVLAVEHAGLRPSSRPVALYVGSWSNWSADPRRPVATGSSRDGDRLRSAP